MRVCGSKLRDAKITRVGVWNAICIFSLQLGCLIWVRLCERTRVLVISLYHQQTVSRCSKPGFEIWWFQNLRMIILYIFMFVSGAIIKNPNSGITKAHLWQIKHLPGCSHDWLSEQQPQGHPIWKNMTGIKYQIISTKVSQCHTPAVLQQGDPAPCFSGNIPSVLPVVSSSNLHVRHTPEMFACRDHKLFVIVRVYERELGFLKGFHPKP